MGRSVGASLEPRLAAQEGGRIAAIAHIMHDIGYDAVAKVENGEDQIEAHNCVFHELAVKCPEVCHFDLALLAESSGRQVEHRSCMVRGDDACRFRFLPASRTAAGKK
jgi:predicted ArsR family transcriptional regulator